MHDLFLFLHLIGLSMAVGTGFANLFLASAAAKLDPAERGTFMSRTMVVVRMGQIGLGLLVLSGLYLMTPYWSVLSEMPTLMAKLTCVVLVLVLVTVMTLVARKARQTNNPALLMKLKPWGMVNFFLGLTIVVLAVLTFH